MCWKSLCFVVRLRRAGETGELWGEDGVGLEGREELAMNLSRKCCSQSAEGMAWFVCSQLVSWVSKERSDRFSCGVYDDRIVLI